jgi:hypothetical protein
MITVGSVCIGSGSRFAASGTKRSQSAERPKSSAARLSPLRVRSSRGPSRRVSHGRRLRARIAGSSRHKRAGRRVVHGLSRRLGKGLLAGRARRILGRAVGRFFGGLPGRLRLLGLLVGFRHQVAFGSPEGKCWPPPCVPWSIVGAPGTNPTDGRFRQNGRRLMAAHASQFSRLDPVEIAMIAASIGLVTLVGVIF